jgi:hypothetical protein
MTIIKSIYPSKHLNSIYARCRIVTLHASSRQSVWSDVLYTRLQITRGHHQHFETLPGPEGYPQEHLPTREKLCGLLITLEVKTHPFLDW